MLIRRIMQQLPFPDPARADPAGLLAYGGDLSPERLVSAYAHGVFPWYESGPILWFSPDPRLVLVPAELRVNRSLRKNLLRRRFEVRADGAFEEVVRSCAAAPRPGQSGTWITKDMIEAYCRLHELGLAHSVESWQADELVGGIYGVSLGAAFFGESMFTRKGDASKVALVHLVRQIERWGFRFLDCQVYTDHMARMGATSWPRDRFLRELGIALETPTRRGCWTLDPPGRPDSGWWR